MSVQNLSFIYERTFDNYFYRCFPVMFTHERGGLFHGEGADLTCSVLFLKNVYVHLFVHDLFDLSNKQGGRVL